MNRVLILIATGFVLSACTQTVFVKPGAAPGEWQQTKAACLLEGAQKVPLPTAYYIEPASSYESTNCHNSRCTSYSSFTPPSVQSVEQHSPLRDEVIKACLARNGWLEQEQ